MNLLRPTIICIEGRFAWTVATRNHDLLLGWPTSLSILEAV